MSYEHTWEDRGVVKRFWGVLSGLELAKSAEESAADPRFDDLRFVILDCLDVESHAFDAPSLERLAVVRFGSMSTNPNIRVLMVTQNAGLAAFADTATKGGLFRGSYETKSFPTVALARTWLSHQPALNVSRRYD